MAVGEDAISILRSSGEAMANLDSYIADSFSGSGSNRVRTTTHFRRNPDGFVEMRLQQVRLLNHRTNITIINREGRWFIWKGHAMKFAPTVSGGVQAEMVEQLLGRMPTNNIDISASVSETNYDGVPCFVVHQSLDTGTFGQSLNAAAKSSARGSDLFKNVKPDELVPHSIDYIIGKENRFLYSKTAYGADGASLPSFSYENVRLNEPVEGSLFEIPSTLSKQEFTSQAEMAKYMGNQVRQLAGRAPSGGHYGLVFFLLTSAVAGGFIYIVSRKRRSRVAV